MDTHQFDYLLKPRFEMEEIAASILGWGFLFGRWGVFFFFFVTFFFPLLLLCFCRCSKISSQIWCNRQNYIPRPSERSISKLISWVALQLLVCKRRKRTKGHRNMGPEGDSSSSKSDSWQIWTSAMVMLGWVLSPFTVRHAHITQK